MVELQALLPIHHWLTSYIYIVYHTHTYSYLYTPILYIHNHTCRYSIYYIILGILLLSLVVLTFIIFSTMGITIPIQDFMGWFPDGILLTSRTWPTEVLQFPQNNQPSSSDPVPAAIHHMETWPYQFFSSIRSFTKIAIRQPIRLDEYVC